MARLHQEAASIRACQRATTRHPRKTTEPPGQRGGSVCHAECALLCWLRGFRGLLHVLDHAIDGAAVRARFGTAVVFAVAQTTVRDTANRPRHGGDNEQADDHRRRRHLQGNNHGCILVSRTTLPAQGGRGTSARAQTFTLAYARASTPETPSDRRRATRWPTRRSLPARRRSSPHGASASDGRAGTATLPVPRWPRR